jgi:AhpD family alkylhydroperoxidase
MTTTIDYAHVLPGALNAMLGLQRVADGAGLEPKLVELVKMRASQLNGCAHCLDMHSKDARAIGEEERRLHVLAAWREAPCYSDRERAALAWCEALTMIAQDGPPDAAYQDLTRHFSPKEIVALTLEVVAINGWNRLAVGFHLPVGDYVSRRTPAESAPAPGGTPESGSDTLDVRSLPHARRHRMIFDLLDRLPAGGALTLVNDHDPAPLRYQLEATRGDEYGWEYLETGPEVWRVRIARR